MVEAIKSDISKSVKGFQIKYSSFVNQTSALNVNTTREALPLQFKDQLISSRFYLKSKSIQTKSSEEMILVLLTEHLEEFTKS